MLFYFEWYSLPLYMYGRWEGQNLCTCTAYFLQYVLHTLLLKFSIDLSWSWSTKLMLEWPLLRLITGGYSSWSYVAIKVNHKWLFKLITDGYASWSRATEVDRWLIEKILLKCELCRHIWSTFRVQLQSKHN